MMAIIAIWFFILGIIFGSFIDCAVDRLEKKEDVIFQRSYCPKCHHPLAWFDLIPIISFVFLKGRCRYCHQRISWEYPLVELSTGLLFVLVFLFGGINILTVFLGLVSIPLLLIFIFDWKNYLIPEKIVYPTLGLVLLFWLSLDLYQKHFFVLQSSHFFLA